MPTPAPRDTAGEHLARIQQLWVELQHARDAKQRERLAKRLREETEAYKRETGRDFDN